MKKYLGKWHFKEAVSHRAADIQNFRVLDNMLIIIEEKANDTLLVIGHMRIGDTCVNQNWTYHIYPGRADLELEGKPKRRNVLWSGSWANCANCLIFEEVDPPLKETDTTDSLKRFMLYSREKTVDSEVVTTFLQNSACHGMSANFRLPQTKEFCP